MGVFIQVDYTDIEGTAFKIEFDDDTYSGDITQVQGKATLTRPKVKTMDMLRGSYLDIELEADTTSDYYLRLIETVGDKKIGVTFYKGGSVYWNGYVKPDGIFESFVTDYWLINVQAVDGLGYLDNIKFLDSSGNIYQDSVSELELLTRCLELTGVSMQFRIYDMNLHFSVDDNDPVYGQQPIEDTYVNADRFVKDDNASSVFTVKEVLESILKKYGCFVTQQDNLWHIVRIIDYYNGNAAKYFKLYDTDGSLISVLGTLMGTSLGSDIDGYDPYHASANQSKTYSAALGAYKVKYKYGLVKSVLENPKIYFSDAVGTISGWIVETSLSNFNFTLQDAIPTFPSGYYIAEMLPSTSNTPTEALSYDYTTFDNDVVQDDILKVEIVCFSKLDYSGAFLVYKQKAKVTLIGDSGTVYYLNKSGEWTLSDTLYNIFIYRNIAGFIDREVTQTTTITSNGVPEDGTMNVQIYRPQLSSATDNGTYTVVRSVNITGIGNDVKGESWTARRLQKQSTVVDETTELAVGDNESEIYIGGIEDVNGDNTLRWSKADGIIIDPLKQYPILNWLARDRMTISSGNATMFKGGIYGYLDYLGDLSINNVTGVFMTVEWKYDTAQNRIEATHERIFNNDIYSEVTVDFQLEAENVVRPAIE